MAYTENKKIGALTQITGAGPSVQIDNNDNVVIEQGGVAKFARISQLIARIFKIEENIGTPVTSDSAVVIQQDGSIKKASLTGLVPQGSITNLQINSAAAIADTKLATISTAGKVLDSATSATSASTNDTIVKRDGSGNFSANIISAALSGTATSATNITGGAAGNVLYQSGAGTTAKLPNAANTEGKYLRSNGEGVAPSWESFSASTSTANNLSGGATGSIPYQNAANSTLFLAAGTDGALLTTRGATAFPEWTNVATTVATPNTIVKRNNDGNFRGNTITATLFSGSISGTTGTFSSTVTASSFNGPASSVATGAVGTAGLANNAVTSVKIADGSITGAKLAGDVSTSSVLSSYSLVLSDSGKSILVNSSSAVTITISSAVAFPTGTIVMVSRLGSGDVTIAGSGVTLRSANSNTKISLQYASVALLKISASEWLISGSLKP